MLFPIAIQEKYYAIVGFEESRRMETPETGITFSVKHVLVFSELIMIFLLHFTTNSSKEAIQIRAVKQIKINSTH